MAPAWLMSCSGFGPPSKTPADLSPVRCLWHPRTILAEKEVVKKQLPCLGREQSPGQCFGLLLNWIRLGLSSKTPTTLSRLVATLCLGENPGLLGKRQAEATEARSCWHLQAEEGFLQWGWRLQQHPGRGG